MFTAYLDKAMALAEYEQIEDGTYFATIPGFEGLWGNGEGIEAARTDLKGALEDWLVLKLWDRDDDIPVLGKLSFKPRKVRMPSARKKNHEPNATTIPERTRKAS